MNQLIELQIFIRTYNNECIQLKTGEASLAQRLST